MRMTRKNFVLLATGAPLATRLGAFEPQAQSAAVRVSPRLDILVRNARIVDGTGAPSFLGDIAVRGDQIAAIGQLSDATAGRIIDAGGHVATPGFIDPHTHEEILMLRDAGLECFVRQGVTTLVNGNCGHSPFPFPSMKILEYWWREGLISRKAYDELSKQAKWDSLTGYAAQVQRVGGASVNSALLLGYGGIRWIAMGGAYDRAPTSEEWKRLEMLVTQGLEQGAVGMSTGLSYIPCRYATTDELVRVARILARFNRTYASHTRFGAPGDPTGGREAIAIGERSGCRVQISHFAAASVEALEMVRDARSRGIQVAGDIIPSSLSHRRRSDRMLEALYVFSPGMFDKSLDELRAYIRTPEGRANAAKSVQFFNTPKEQMVVVHADTPKNLSLVGKSVAAIGREQGRDPVNVLADLVLDEQNPVVFTFDGDRRQINEPSAESLERRYGKGQFLQRGEWTKHPLFMPGSDTITIDPVDRYGWYEQQRRGAFPAYFEQARTHEVPLESAVSKATSLAASQFGLHDRGMLAVGRKADIAVFNPSQYKFPTPADSDPNVPGTVASGMQWVIVNGTIVLDNGKLTGSRPGRVLFAT